MTINRASWSQSPPALPAVTMSPGGLPDYRPILHKGRNNTYPGLKMELNLDVLVFGAAATLVLVTLSKSLLPSRY